MTDTQAAALARRIPKEARRACYVKLGRTNGRHCLHVVERDALDRSRAAFTVYSEGEWGAHDLNQRNKRSGGAESFAAEPLASKMTPAIAERLGAPERAVGEPDA